MARYKRIPQKIGGQVVYTAHRDYPDVCPACGGYILRCQWYGLKGGVAYHMRCLSKPDQLAALETKSKPKVKLHPNDVAGRKRRAERKKACKERKAEKRRRNAELAEIIAAQIQEERDMVSRFEHAIGGDYAREEG